MRIRLFFIVVTSVIIMSCGNESSSSSANDATRIGNTSKQTTSIQWIDSAKNFGRINEGQKLAVSFRFKNTGDKPLVIQSVQPSCGCTVADYPKEPISPGSEGEITGEFDSHGREGLQHKELTVLANTRVPEHKIYFEVNVVKKEGTTDQNSSN